MVHVDDLAKAREEKRAVYEQMASLLKETGGKFDPEQQTKWDRMDADFKEKETTLENIERMNAIATGMSDVREDEERHRYAANTKTAGSENLTWKDQENVFRGMLLGNNRITNPEIRRSLEKAGVDPSQDTYKMRRPTFRRSPKSVAEVREMLAEARERGQSSRAEVRASSNALSHSTATEGVETVPNNLMTALELYLVAFGGMRERATIIRRNSGASLPIPVLSANSTTDIGALLAENTATTTHSPAFVQHTMSAYKYTTKLIKASIEFLQDTSIDAASVLGDEMGRRIGRITNLHFTSGSASGQPMGVVGASTNSSLAGKTSSTYTAATGVLNGDYIDLIHSVDPIYRENDAFMFSDTTLSLLKKLVDSQSRPLWIPSIRDGEPATFNGKPYIINQDFADYSATTGGLKVAAYGNWSKYWIMDVMDMEVMRLNERYAELAQVAWVGFMRTDGAVVNRFALKHLVTGST